MGSFNMRCFASGQIIGPGDPYWVIPIKRELTYSARKLTVRGESKERYGTSASFCYPGSYWAPVSGPILLRYEDCGSGKLVHSRANVLWLWVLFHTLLEHSAVCEKGSNEYHDYEFDFIEFVKTNNLADHFRGPIALEALGAREFFNQSALWWDYFSERVLENRVFLAYGSRAFEPQPVSFALVHGRAMDALMSRALACEQGGHTPPRAAFEKVVRDSRALLTGEETDKAVFNFSFKNLLYNLLRNYAEDLGHVYGGFWLKVIDTVTDPGPQLDVDKLYHKYREHLEFGAFLNTLDSLALQFEPYRYGSQDYENSTGRAYAEFVCEVERAIASGKQ